MILVYSSDTLLAERAAQQLQAAGHECAVRLWAPPSAPCTAAPTEGDAPQQVIVASLQAADGDDPSWPLGRLLNPAPDQDGAGREAVEAACLPWPVSLIGPAHGHLATLLEQGLAGWWPLSVLDDGQALSTALAADRTRWLRDRALRAELAEVREQLEGRKWIERAKGVLMAARGIKEDEAFRLLRGASMQSNLKVGDVCRSVLEAAQWAEAINRAGQLRMLSQRLVKLAAQRQAGIDARRTRALQDEAMQRAQDNIDHLAALPQVTQGPAPLQTGMAATQTAWRDLKKAVDLRQTAPALAIADQRADALLTAADVLTDLMEAQAGRRALHIINLCGCQRMRVQRLAKTALLDFLHVHPEGSFPLAPLLDEFEAALVVLEQAPLSNAEIRHALACARDEWLRLLQGLRGTSGEGSRVALSQSSDVLLNTFDRLTVYYEHSLQVIMS